MRSSNADPLEFWLVRMVTVSAHELRFLFYFWNLRFLFSHTAIFLIQRRWIEIGFFCNSVRDCFELRSERKVSLNKRRFLLVFVISSVFSFIIIYSYCDFSHENDAWDRFRRNHSRLEHFIRLKQVVPSVCDLCFVFVLKIFVFVSTISPWFGPFFPRFRPIAYNLEIFLVSYGFLSRLFFDFIFKEERFCWGFIEFLRRFKRDF